MREAQSAQQRPAPGARLFSCFDFRLRSEIVLGELIPADDSADDRPIVEVRLGAVPEALPGGSELKYGIQAAGGEVLLIVPGTVRFLVRGGREILVQPLSEGAERNVRLFLLGSALGILCHQRGLLPLHANAIVVDGQAIAFSGHSGSGKSTLAAYFQRAGYELLCDDVCMIRFDAEGAPWAWPGLPRLKLWGDAMEAFGHDRAGLDRAIEGLDKFHVPMARASVPRPIPFRALYVLSKAEDEGAITQLRGQAAVEALMAQTYRGQYLEAMGLAMRHFHQCIGLVSQAKVYAASRVWGYDVFKREAEALERHVAGEIGKA